MIDQSDSEKSNYKKDELGKKNHKKERNIKNDNKILTQRKKLKKNKMEKERNKINKDNIEHLTSIVQKCANTIEVNKKIPSKKQLKKEKAEQCFARAQKISRQETARKALDYISKWKHDRNNWKFEKLKQIWLIDYCFNKKYVPDNYFLISLEYFEGCKGLSRKQLINKAMEIVKRVEDDNKIDNEIFGTIQYKRARQLIQTLPDKT